MAEAASAMREVMSREEELCEGIHKLQFLVAYFQWQMAGWVWRDSHEFGLRPANLHTRKRLASSYNNSSIAYWGTQADGANMAM